MPNMSQFRLTAVTTALLALAACSGLGDLQTPQLEVLGVHAGRETVGHPTLSPHAFSVRDSGDYRAQLAERGIEVRFEARCAHLESEMAARAAAAGGILVQDPGLLAKLGAICEIPGVMEGAFDPALLELPAEVLRTSLRDHQSAFSSPSSSRARSS